jgi:hypothetical protein
MQSIYILHHNSNAIESTLYIYFYIAEQTGPQESALFINVQHSESCLGSLRSHDPITFHRILWTPLKLRYSNVRGGGKLRSNFPTERE